MSAIMNILQLSLSLGTSWTAYRTSLSERYLATLPGPDKFCKDLNCSEDFQDVTLVREDDKSSEGAREQEDGG